jgi:hypothetical protein
MSLLATFFGAAAPFWKNMKIILSFNFFANVFAGLSYFFIGGYSGTVGGFVGGVQLIINYVFLQKKGKIPAYVVALHIITFVVLNMFVYNAWYDIVMISAAILFVLSVAQKDAKSYRYIYFANSAALIAYDILSKAHGNLFMHCIMFSATVISIIMKNLKKKQTKRF